MSMPDVEDEAKTCAAESSMRLGMWTDKRCRRVCNKDKEEKCKNTRCGRKCNAACFCNGGASQSTPKPVPAPKPTPMPAPATTCSSTKGYESFCQTRCNDANSCAGACRKQRWGCTGGCACTAVDKPATTGGSGSWTVHTMQHENQVRTYHVYVPSSGGSEGLMMFIHGCCLARGQASVEYYKSSWQIEASAEAYGFVGVMPMGSTGKSDGTLNWNVDEPSGTNEVTFLHKVVQGVIAANSIPADAPKIILGFSNGAAISLLMGCQPKPWPLWSAHIAVHYKENANYPSTCDERAAVWNGIGDNDLFISSLRPNPSDGVRNQFSEYRDSQGCPSQNPTVAQGSDYSCYEYPKCSIVGQLCLYHNTGHNVESSMTRLAWSYLAGQDHAELLEDSDSDKDPEKPGYGHGAEVKPATNDKPTTGDKPTSGGEEPKCWSEVKAGVWKCNGRLAGCEKECDWWGGGKRRLNNIFV